jgi:tripartite-type tricarboxylate transporter receptor subunit TctC
MKTPAMRARMTQLGYDAVGSTPEEFAAFQQRELVRTAELVRLSGASVE